MKKVFKIVGIVAIVVIVLVCLFWGVLFFGEKLEQQKLDNNRINNSKTLSQYIEYHGIGYSTDELNFYAEDIKCDLLKDRDILYLFDDSFDNGFLILDDYTIYETAFNSDKTYSNGQQIKEIESNIEIKKVQIHSDTIFLASADDRYYYLRNGDITELLPQNTSGYRYDMTLNFLKDERVRKVFYRVDAIYKFFVIKNDGQVYEQTYKENGILSNETLILSNKDYGNITDISYETMGNGKYQIKKVVSDNGLYYLNQTNEQEYIDTEPTYALVPSDIYTKYKSDIKYIDSKYIVTTDNNIILTDMLCRDIDKEVK